MSVRRIVALELRDPSWREYHALFRFGHVTFLMKQDFQDAHPC
jgi:hypothetical protein